MTTSHLLRYINIAVVGIFGPFGIFAPNGMVLPGTFPVVIVVADSEAIHHTDVGFSLDRFIGSRSRGSLLRSVHSVNSFIRDFRSESVGCQGFL